MTTTPDLKPRSRDVTDGLERTAARGMLRAVGLGDEDFAKPQLGIASSWNEITPCNLSLQRLAQAAKDGVHALAWADGELVGHAAVVQRRLLHGGRALRTGYVDGVGVRADRRGERHGVAMMTALQDVIRLSYEIGALAATAEALDFYAALGWQVWRGPTFALTPDGVRRTPQADGAVHVLPLEGVALDLDGDVTCDWRDGDLW